MKLSSPMLALSTALLANAGALPNVTPKVATTDYPGNPAGMPCGAWPFNYALVTDSTEDPEMNGFALQTDEAERTPGDANTAPYPTRTFTVDLRRSKHFAGNRGAVFQCGSELKSAKRLPVSIFQDRHSAIITYGYGRYDNYYAGEVYNHFVDGVKQEGLFFGAENQTTWEFTHHEPREGLSYGRKGAFYSTRLLGLPQSKYDGDTVQLFPNNTYWTSDHTFKGFLRLDGEYFPAGSV